MLVPDMFSSYTSFHLWQLLSVCRSNSCLIDLDSLRHLLISSQKRSTNNTPSVYKRTNFVHRFLVFLDPLKKDARGRHNIIGCTKVGHPLSFEESIYGVLEPWKLASLHRELSRCSTAPSLALIRSCFERRICSMVLLVSKKNIKCRNLSGNGLPERRMDITWKMLWGNSSLSWVWKSPLASMICWHVWLEEKIMQCCVSLN